MSVKSFLKNSKRSINKYTYLHWGIQLLSGTLSSSHYRSLKQDMKTLIQQSATSEVAFPISNLYPCYQDKADNAGSLMLHYFYQDIYVAQQILKNNPARHVDIGSRIDGFIAHVATFREIEVFDIRPLDIAIPHIKFTQADLMNLDKDQHACSDSVSCLHALEHFGLGRYGDPICFDGYLIGFNNIASLLKPEGRLYFSVPMGKQRIEFHAHRVFSLRYLLQLVSGYYTIESFSYVNDKNMFFADINLDTLADAEIDNNLNCNFGCAIFVLIKK